MTADDLKELFNYNEITGDLIWLIALNPKKPQLVGKRAGSIDTNGHRSVTIKGKTYPATHIIWCMVTGKWPKHEIDHINRIPNDDSFCNLREATRQQNCANRRKFKNR